jgi:hypothetical protein
MHLVDRIGIVRGQRRHRVVAADASICRLRNVSMAPCLTMVAIQVIGEAIAGS